MITQAIAYGNGAITLGSIFQLVLLLAIWCLVSDHRCRHQTGNPETTKQEK